MNDKVKEEGAKPAKPVGRRNFLRGAMVGGVGGLVVGGLAVKGASELSKGAEIKPKGFSRARPIKTDWTLPKKVDVAIIGGGIVGVSAALELAERGVSVALFEKGAIAGESSGRAGGLIEAQFAAPEKMEITELSKQRWRQLNAMTGEQTTFVQDGSTVLFTNPDEMEYAKMWVDSVKGLPNAGARMLSAKEAANYAPGTVEKIIGGLTCPEDGCVEPQYAAPAIALGARKKGAKIYQNCAVREIERTGGRVSAVITERGRVEASTVIMASGVWTPMLGHDLDIDVPVVQCFAKGMSLLPFDGPNTGTTTISTKTMLGWRRQFDGGYLVWEFLGLGPVLPQTLKHLFDLMPALEANAAAMSPRFNFSTFLRWMMIGQQGEANKVSPYEKTRIYEPEIDIPAMDRGFMHLQQAMPVFENAAVRERWGGVMQMCIDNMPIISKVDAIPGLIIGNGFLYGMTMGPGAGILLADIAMGRKPPIDMKNYRFSRFSDGSKIGFYA